MEKGILLLAVGKRGYAFAAHNIAYSIKHFNKDIKITCVIDREISKYIDKNIFDKVVPAKPVDFKTDGRIDPGKLKTKMHEYSPYKNTLYLDVDALVLKDIEPLFDDLISRAKDKGLNYITDVIDKGGKKEVINYSIWASNSDIWSRFNLKEDSVLPAIQSSWAYFNSKSKAFFNQVNREYEKGFDRDKLQMNWGGTLPDELFFSAVCAKKNIIPEYDRSPIFFGNKYSLLSYKEIEEKFYVLSVYGNGKGRTLTKYKYIDWYDRLMFRYKRSNREEHLYKINYIMQDKHANSFK